MRADLENEMRAMGDRLLAEAPPVTTDEVIRYSAERRSPTTTSIDPLIGDVPVLADITDITSARRRSRRSVLIASVAAASMLAVGLGVAAGVSDSDDPTAVGTAPATNVAPTSPAPTTVAVASPTSITPAVGSDFDLSWPPRVLLDDSWPIVDANERSANEGYTIFTRDGMSVFVGWYRGQLPDNDYYAQQGFTDAGTATMLGQTVSVYASPPMFSSSEISALLENGQLESDIVGPELDAPGGSVASLPEGADFGDYIGGPMLEEELADVIDAGLIEGISDSLETRIVWDQASLSVQIRPLEPGVEPAMDDLVSVLGALHPVEATEWEAALPDEVVPIGERPEVVAEMLTGILLPEGFTQGFIDELGSRQLVQTRVAIADEIVKSIACSWLTSYFAAVDGNTPEGTNPESAQAAADAIRAMPDWPVAQELAAAMANPAPGIIPVPNSSLLGFSVGEDGSILYLGEPAGNDDVVMLCHVDAAG